MTHPIAIPKTPSSLPELGVSSPVNSILSELTIFTNYSKYLPEKNRRESWEEIVARTEAMHCRRFPAFEKDIKHHFKAVYNREVFASMRTMQFGGLPIEKSHVRGYNCCFLHMDTIESFAETFYLLLSGVGVGYSVQPQHTEKLPAVSLPTRTKKFFVEDSIEGWAEAEKYLLRAYLDENQNWLPEFDYSFIRPKGALLVTTGGKAPGSEPLALALKKIGDLLGTKEEGSRLSTVEAHDINCLASDAVMAGGIRRAAMIALFSRFDQAMLKCKSNFPVADYEELPDGSVWVLVDEPGYGRKSHTVWVSDEDKSRLKAESVLPWYYFQGQRGRANNSVLLLKGSVSYEDFFEIWRTVEQSGAGEPGFVWTKDLEWGFNPCVEASLPPYTFCNLSTIVAGACTSQEKFNELAYTAAFIGTLQASYTDFNYLRPIWKEKTSLQALLGVSLTGVANESFLALDERAAALECRKSNSEWAKKLCINKAHRICCMKPEGKTSWVAFEPQGAGGHAWHGVYFIHNRQLKKGEPLYEYFMETIPELVWDNPYSPQTEAILSVPVKAPAGAITRAEPATDLLQRVKRFQKNWVLPGHREGVNPHNVSATVTIKPTEWAEVGQWFWDNKDYYGGLSVLPEDSGTYLWTPYQDCTKEEYERLAGFAKKIDLTKVIERTDKTELRESVACGGGACSL